MQLELYRFVIKRRPSNDNPDYTDTAAPAAAASSDPTSIAPLSPAVVGEVHHACSSVYHDLDGVSRQLIDNG